MDKGRTGCESRILAGSVPQGLEGLEDARGPMANSLSFVAGLARSQGKRALGVWGVLDEMSRQSLRPPVGVLIRAVMRGWLVGVSVSMGRPNSVKCHLAAGPRKSGHRLLALSTADL